VIVTHDENLAARMDGGVRLTAGKRSGRTG